MMKRLILSLPIAVISFAIGTVLAPHSDRAECMPAQPIEAAPVPSTVAFVEPANDKDHFEPEFRDLDDFVWKEYKLKLVDVGLNGNAYRKSEVIAKDGEQWVGLFEEDGQTLLRKVTTKVRLDPKYEGYGDEDYVRLTTNGGRQPHVLLKNSRRFKEGRVETSYLGPTWAEVENRGLSVKEMRLGFKEEFMVGERSYILRVTSGLTKEGRKVNALVLESEDVSQVVTHNEYYSDGHTLYDTIGNLQWAGDLDRDGRLDLYIEHYNYEKGGFSSTLFLSTEEGSNGPLINEAAWFGTAGC